MRASRLQSWLGSKVGANKISAIRQIKQLNPLIASLLLMGGLEANAQPSKKVQAEMDSCYVYAVKALIDQDAVVVMQTIGERCACFVNRSQQGLATNDCPKLRFTSRERYNQVFEPNK